MRCVLHVGRRPSGNTGLDENGTSSSCPRLTEALQEAVLIRIKDEIRDRVGSGIALPELLGSFDSHGWPLWYITTYIVPAVEDLLQGELLECETFAGTVLLIPTEKDWSVDDVDD